MLKCTRKTLAFLSAILMLLTVVPTGAFAYADEAGEDGLAVAVEPAAPDVDEEISDNSGIPVGISAVTPTADESITPLADFDGVVIVNEVPPGGLQAAVDAILIDAGVPGSYDLVTSLKWSGLYTLYPTPSGSPLCPDQKFMRDSLKNLTTLDISGMYGFTDNYPYPDYYSPFGPFCYLEITTLILPDKAPGDETLPAGFFGFCRNLTTVAVGNNKVTPGVVDLTGFQYPIGVAMFSNCEEITSVRIPANLPISQEAFLQCSKLTTITLDNQLFETGVFDLRGYTGTLGDYVFQSCGPVILRIDDNLSLPTGAFFHCFSLKSLAVGKSIPVMDEFNFTGFHGTIGEKVFQGTGVVYIRIPADMILTECMFDESYSLTTLAVGENEYIEGLIDLSGSMIKSLPGYVFGHGESLVNIRLSENLESIGYAAFMPGYFTYIKSVLFQSISAPSFYDDYVGFDGDTTIAYVPYSTSGGYEDDAFLQFSSWDDSVTPHFKAVYTEVALFSTQPQSTGIHYGDSATFTVVGLTPAGIVSDAPCLQWQVSTDGGTTWTDIDNEHGTSLTITGFNASMDGNLYRVVATNFLGAQVFSNAANLHRLSSEAALLSVAAQPITAGSEAGTQSAPKTASINVDNPKGSVGRADIVVSDCATFNLYSGAGFTNEITGSSSIALTAGATTTIYIKVTAEDTSTVCYYSVAITRAANPTYTLTVVSGTGSGNFEAGATVSITANTVAGKTFRNWTSSAGGNFANPSATTTIFTMPANAVTVTANYASANVDLDSVANQIVVTGGGSGTSDSPKTAQINVPSNQKKIGCDDIKVAADADFKLYRDPGYSDEVTGTGTIALDEGTTVVYIKVVAEDGTECFYKVDVISPGYHVIYHFGTFTGSGSSKAASYGPADKFVRLTTQPAGLVVDPASYTITSGSTIITFSEAYLKTLPNGSYTYRAEFTDGYTDLVLQVSRSQAPTPPPSIPSTGDSTWMVLAAAGALMALGVAFVTFSRRRYVRRHSS